MVVVLLLGFIGNITVILSKFIVAIDWQQYFTYSTDAPRVNCRVVENLFGDNLPQVAYMEYQYAELSKFPKNQGDYVFLNERITRMGALQCLCK